MSGRPLPIILLMTALGCAGCQDGTRSRRDVSANNKDQVSMSESSEAHKHTNRLIHSTSPYLLQHAHNPVNWYEWGPEALAQAKAENKPIFLSIGYSACHWCHVMERESFESEEIAAVMNEHFVCIKVDREERPDLDEIYMAATQALTRSGGWPMSVWLTPDQRPFFAGTYFPPTERYGRPGFKEVLLYLSGAWNDEREKVVQQAAHLTEAVRQMTRVEPGNSIVPVSVVDDTADRLAAAFDVVKGGMSGGGTNKFPPSMAMDLMLRVQHARTASGDKSTRLVELVEITLDHMARGGIYDHLGGGIARYSTDTDWLVPHFEKMLYDQALVSDIYLKAYRYTGKALYAETAADIFDYVITDLQSPEGGYYSTRDADSEGEEGKFYVWTHGEVVSVLGDEAAALFCDYYDVTEGGNWEGHNILNIQRPIETVAKLNEIAVDELKNRLAASRKKLFDIREQRIKPGLDDKVLSGWNGLMIASMAKGARILDNDRYCRSAEAAADFVLSKMRDAEGRLLRTYRKGKTHTLAYLDDYAFMIDALITLYETTFEEKRLEQAEALNAQLLEHYRDQESGGFFLTSDEAEETLVRAKSITDNAIPSGNSVQFMNLQRLSVLLGRKDLAEEAQGTLKAFSKRLTEMPFASERMLTGLDFFHRRPREIAIACRRESQVGADALVNAAWQAYVPNAIIARLIEDAPDADSVARKVPLLSGKKTLDGRPTAYVCENYACQAPTTEVKTLLEQLGKQALSEQ